MIRWKMAFVVGVAILLAPASAAYGQIDFRPCALSLDRMFRAIHMSGNWGANPVAVAAWNEDRSRPLVPSSHLEWLHDVHVNWVGISVALHFDDSMDSTVQRSYSPEVITPTFSDDVLRQLIREYREHDFNVYLTLAFEVEEAYVAERPVQRWQLGDPGDPDTGVPSDDPMYALSIEPEFWPWRPNHPDHGRFVEEFWRTYTEQAVHFARIAQEEGVQMYSLGTETDRLFRTRSGGLHWRNDFDHELRSLVRSVRSEYDGLLTYDMHFTAVVEDWFAPGSEFLWEDLDLDVVGISAWFPLVESPPSEVMSVDALRQEYERLFDEHIAPLAAANTGRPIVFLEYGTTDTVEAPADPGGYPEDGEYVFSDTNGNGLDDGEETQANIIKALFETMGDYTGMVRGAFFWDNWISSDKDWRENHGTRRTYSFRMKPAEDVVRQQYACWSGEM